MPAPQNRFKQSILAGQRQIGLWLGLANAYTAELAGTAGFDWLVIDGEHAPNDIRSMLAQLQALAASPSHAVVRVPIGETWMIKQVLDIGAQTLLVPMVESADQARQLVAATRYPPHGVRGIGSALARASHFNAIGDYIATAAEEICLLLQVETPAGVAAIPDLVGIEGVDGIFVGPSDLAASMGYPGNPAHPDVQAVVVEAIKRIVAGGKPAGILTADPILIDQYLSIGAAFVAVGSDVAVLRRGLVALRDRFRA
jgi:4-hydroxy-2-oxoheptanedioate aldolase